MDYYTTNIPAAAYLARECDAGDWLDGPTAADLVDDDGHGGRLHYDDLPHVHTFVNPADGLPSAWCRCGTHRNDAVHGVDFTAHLIPSNEPDPF